MPLPDKVLRHLIIVCCFLLVFIIAFESIRQGGVDLLALLIGGAAMAVGAFLLGVGDE